MRFPYTLIALLLGLTSTVLAQNNGPPRHLGCPATHAMRQVNNDDAYGQTAPPPELRVSQDSCSQQDRSSEQACIEGSATRANSEHRQPASSSSSHGKAISGSTRKPGTKNTTRVAFRRPLPARSYLYYRRLRHAMALREYRIQEQREALLARSQHLGRLASKYGDGYKLKVGNYHIPIMI